MKLPNTSFLQCVVVTATLLALPIEIIAANAGADQSGDPGWPRERNQNGTRLLVYQPQVDDWKNFQEDRKSTRLNSSHSQISYAVFCLKKKIKHITRYSAECRSIINIHDV